MVTAPKNSPHLSGFSSADSRICRRASFRKNLALGIQAFFTDTGLSKGQLVEENNEMQISRTQRSYRPWYRTVSFASFVRMAADFRHCSFWAVSTVCIGVGSHSEPNPPIADGECMKYKPYVPKKAHSGYSSVKRFQVKSTNVDPLLPKSFVAFLPSLSRFDPRGLRG